MPRRRRRWEPGAIHHVSARGHCGSPIFATDADRAFVVDRARRALDETGATCLGWSVMNNHYHMLVRCEGPPGPTFGSLNSALASRVVGFRGGRGAVFQGRFFSDECEGEESVLSRLAYVVANPVHHALVGSIDELRTYTWSALGEILGTRPALLCNAAETLALVHPDSALAPQALVDLLERRAAAWSESAGDPETIVKEILRQACAQTGADLATVIAGGRTAVASRARAMAAHLACDVGGLPLDIVAPFLGVGATALVRARRRGRPAISAVSGTVPGPAEFGRQGDSPPICRTGAGDGRGACAGDGPTPRR